MASRGKKQKPARPQIAQQPLSAYGATMRLEVIGRVVEEAGGEAIAVR